MLTLEAEICNKYCNSQEFPDPHQPGRGFGGGAAADRHVAPHPEEVGRETRPHHARRPGDLTETK